MTGACYNQHNQTAAVNLDVDAIVLQLLEHRNSNKQIQLSEFQIRDLCAVCREIFLAQPNLLELAAPVNILGDIHGQFEDLLKHFETCGYPPKKNYLMLGDYVDRGKRSLECICLVLAFKVKYPENFFLLRGNHESASINRIYGFYDECKRRYNIKLWKTFTDCFNCMPIAAVVENTIFAMHGGLSPDLKSMEDIIKMERPNDVPDSGLMCDLLWSDPDEDISGWGENDRGVSFTFGADVIRIFLEKNNFSLIVRAHQVVEDGYQFFARRRLVTVFSAPNYCGEFDNAAAILHVDEDLTCSFSIHEDFSACIIDTKFLFHHGMDKKYNGATMTNDSKGRGVPLLDKDSLCTRPTVMTHAYLSMGGCVVPGGVGTYLSNNAKASNYRSRRGLERGKAEIGKSGAIVPDPTDKPL